MGDTDAAFAAQAPCSADRHAFLKLLRQGVRAKVQSSELRGATLAHRSPSSDHEDADDTKVAAFPSVAEHVHVPAWQTLVWRDAFSTEPFFEDTIGGRPLRIKQVLQGELNGFGTGLTVWPAACVLLKHLDHRVASLADATPSFVIELGSGTGAVGVAAGVLMKSGRVVLTDMAKLEFIMRANADAALSTIQHEHRQVAIDVETYEWGSEPSEQLLPRQPGSNEREYPDLILVSDCILPRLYPIEPLVEALVMLCGPRTRVLISYEHRYYEHFQPKRRFWELLMARGFTLREIDENEYHPHYRADDIEIWEVSPPAAEDE